MKKIVLVFFGFILISFGAIDWAVGALMPHSRILIGAGALAIAAAGFVHRWQRLQKKLTLPMMGLVASPLEKAFDPTKPAPMAQWNPNAVSGWETWVAVAVLCLFYWILIRFLQGCAWRNHPRCNYRQEQ